MRTIELDPTYLDRARRYTTSVAVGEDPDCPYVASAAEFSHTVGVGDTPEEALQVLLELLAATIQTLELDGQPVPEPLSAYSGLLHLRVPKRLHQALAQEAKADGVSLNAAATTLLAAGSVLRSPRGDGADPAALPAQVRELLPRADPLWAASR